MANNFKINPTNQKIENVLPMYEDDGGFSFSDLLKSQTVGEQIQQGLDRDYGNVDRDFSLYERFVKNEPMQQEMYLNRLKDLNKQGGERGGSKSAQLQMAGMNDRYQTEKKENQIVEDKLKEQIEEDARLQKEKEAFMDSPKGRMQTMFNDADKRDAILGGIADAMLETRVGVDAYGNRFNRAQKNVRDNLKIAEATDIARQKAQLDAMKTMAETTKLVDPRQYLTNAQTEADSFVKAQIRAGNIKLEDYDTAYASMLKQIAVKDLTSAKASSISTLFTYAQALQGSDPVTAGILMDAIKSNAIYLAGDGASGEVVTETIDATEYNKKK